MVERFAPLFSGGDSNQQIVFDLILPDEFGHLARAKAGFYGAIFNDGFPRNNTSDVYVLLAIFRYGGIIPYRGQRVKMAKTTYYRYEYYRLCSSIKPSVEGRGNLKP
jgi:hypothetical protein